MPSDRARPLVAFAVVSVVCALVVVTNMARHPHATVTAFQAAQVTPAGPEVRFGSVLAARPRPVPLTGNVLSVALDAPVTAPAPRSHPAPTPLRRVRVARPGVRTPHRRLRHRSRAHARAPRHAPSAPPAIQPGHSGGAPGHLRPHGGSRPRQQASPAPYGHGTGRARVSSASRRAIGEAAGRPGRSGMAPGHLSHPGHGHGHGHGHGWGRGRR